MDKFTYSVYDRNGRPVLQAPESCRYPKSIELSLLDAGYTIKLNGKRITKKEAKNSAIDDHPKSQ